MLPRLGVTVPSAATSMRVPVADASDTDDGVSPLNMNSMLDTVCPIEVGSVMRLVKAMMIWSVDVVIVACALRGPSVPVPDALNDRTLAFAADPSASAMTAAPSFALKFMTGSR
jgi:hypothetical protein